MGMVLCNSFSSAAARIFSLFPKSCCYILNWCNFPKNRRYSISSKNRVGNSFYCHRCYSLISPSFKRVQEARYYSSKMPGKKKEVLQFVRLSEHAVPPTKGSELAAGYDLCSAYDYTIKPMGNALCKTDLQIALPDGCYGRVAPRSGLAVKHFVDVGAGVVDADYRGNLCVVLFNFGKEDFKVKRGDRIAQLICEKISYPELEEVQRLDETVRGENGFGSSGR